CALCGTTPVRRKSVHLFFGLSRQADFLLGLIRQPTFLNAGIANQLQQFFEKGLADWDISRDGPYFGFPIPGETDKFFYVWLDAPIGYIAATEKWEQERGEGKDALAHWSADSKTQIIHFIGKDIVYFHALFWPAVLKVAGLKVPSRLVVHGHLTFEGEKMSKSRGTLISGRQFLDRLDPNYLRFFYAGNLGSGPEDFDLSLKEFRLRVNADLVNTIGNLANRTLSLLAGPLEKRLAPADQGAGRTMVENQLKVAPLVRSALERLDYRAAVKKIVEMAQATNQFLQIQAPWNALKTSPETARRDLSDAAEVVYLLAALLEPVVPSLSHKLFAQLNAPPLTYQQLASASYPLLDRDRPIGTPAPLIGRLEESQVKAILAPESGAPSAAFPSEIEYPDFSKVVLKVGKVLAAERLPKADQLLKLTVDVGEGAPRTIAAGIAKAYAPEQLVGRNVVVVANLKARKLRGIQSQGMILAAGPGGTELSLVDPGPMPPGTEVK
ncbi:MAG TPA: methionine--tRNA ligase subunit beta, partial [Myxococcales bacterium]